MDRNFDGIAPRFKRNIYDSTKGKLRLAVLRRDFAEFLPLDASVTPLRILDAGGGQGQFALELAEMGHQLVLTDISDEMLELAKARLADLPEAVQGRVTILQSPLQELGRHFEPESFDLVMCHAVIEWLNEPATLVPALAPLVRPGGHFSLVFYNLEGMIFKNLLRTNFKKIQREDYQGFRGSLTPTNPLRLDQVREWVVRAGLSELCCSGIRVFHDYIFNATDRQREPDTLEEMELRFSRQLPYRDLGRYMHLLLEKPRS